jgi:hypothetical protein
MSLLATDYSGFWLMIPFPVSALLTLIALIVLCMKARGVWIGFATGSLFATIFGVMREYQAYGTISAS